MGKFSTGFVALLALLIIPNHLFGEYQTISNTHDALAIAPEQDMADSVTQLSPQVMDVLEQVFCSPQVCGEGDWQQWIIITPDSPWAAEELVMLSDILTAVIDSLDRQGLDGRALLSGYRFRRQHEEYITGDHQDWAAVTNHTSQEITLADAAFKRLHGFYIIHELGHVIDQRTERQLSAAFHSLVSSDQQAQITAAGYLLNIAAQKDLEEATADAFALWVMSTYDAGFRVVFVSTPLTADYKGITAALAASLEGLSRP